MAPISQARPQAPSRAPSLALWFLAAGVFAMAVIGAITRLTESGLSIMEWAPLSGALPPLTAAAWESLFALYQKSGEYRAAPLALEDFRAIFWWEWIHRQWGRALALLLAGVWLWLWRRRLLDAPLQRLLALVLALGALQAGVGWWMVASGFSDRTDVAPVRLLFHLLLALVIYALLVHGGLRRWPVRIAIAEAPAPAAPPRSLRFWHNAWRVYLALLFALLATGALVAGGNAGFVYNEWPLMGDALVPLDYMGPAAPGWWQNALANPSAIQFHHRWFAAAMVALALALSTTSWARLKPAPTPHGTASPNPWRHYLLLPAAVSALQFLLGIWTLLAVVPVWLGALHQALAILLLTTTLLALESLRRL